MLRQTTSDMFSDSWRKERHANSHVHHSSREGKKYACTGRGDEITFQNWIFSTLRRKDQRKKKRNDQGARRNGKRASRKGGGSVDWNNSKHIEPVRLPSLAEADGGGGRERTERKQAALKKIFPSISECQGARSIQHRWGERFRRKNVFGEEKTTPE